MAGRCRSQEIDDTACDVHLRVYSAMLMGEIIYQYDDDEISDAEMAEFHQLIANECTGQPIDQVTGRPGTEDDLYHGIADGTTIVEVTREMYESVKRTYGS